jgi:hypothetical protein
MAHSVIPHHHCDELSTLEDKCDNIPVGLQHRPGNIPWHCQAISHLVLIEQQLLLKFKTIVLFQFETLEVRELIKPLSGVPVLCSTYYACNHPFSKPFLSQVILRGPPNII